MSAIRLSISNTNTFTLCGLAFHQVLKMVSSARYDIGKSRKTRKMGASGHPERLKFRKTMLRDVPMSCFLEKWAVGESRSLKIWKTGFRGVPKPKKSEKQVFGESRSFKIWKNKLSGSPETYLSLIKLQTYGNQNNPRRQEGVSKLYLRHTLTFICGKGFTGQQYLLICSFHS